jgi:hypothetical protein
VNATTRILGPLAVIVTFVIASCSEGRSSVSATSTVASTTTSSVVVDAATEAIAPTTTTTALDLDRLGLAEYYAWVGETLALAIGEMSAGPPAGMTLPVFDSARATLQPRADFYRQLQSQFESVTPPAEAQEAHDAYIAATVQNAEALQAAVDRTPEDAPPEEVERYEYANADIGYAFVAETNAKCALNRVFDSYGFEPYVFERWCEPAPRSGASLGTEDEPVNAISLVHTVSTRPGHPNMWFDTTDITTSASEPLVFTFENQNPEPYLFNLAIYEGTPESLEGLEPIAQTVADTGAFTQTLEVELEPGTYTYADNVHAYSMRGMLTVLA